MKSLFCLCASSVLAVGFLSSMRVDPAYACPATNDLFLDFPGNVNASTNGAFTYDITIEGWDLTFEPVGATIEVWDSWFVNTGSLEYTPDSIIVAGLGCDWDPDPVDYEVIQVNGVLANPCNDGAIITEVTVGATGNSKSEYPLTGITATGSCL